MMALRYAYYCLYNSVVNDRDYDKMEKDFLESCSSTSPMLQPGSDSPESYTDYQKQLARELISNGFLGEGEEM